MKDLCIKKAIWAGSYFLLAIALEIITFSLLGLGMFPTYFWFDIAILLFLFALIFIIPSFIAQTVVVLLLLIVQVVIAVANECLYTMSGYIFGMSMLSLAGEAAGAFDPDFVNFGFLALGLILVAAEGALLITLIVTRKCKCAAQLQQTLLLIAAFAFVCAFSPALYAVQKTAFTTTTAEDPLYRFKDESYLYDTQFISANAYRQFGTFGYYYKNIGNFFADLQGESREEDAAVVSALSDYFAQGAQSETLEDLDLTQYGGAGIVAQGMLDGQNIVLIVL